MAKSYRNWLVERRCAERARRHARIQELLRTGQVVTADAIAAYLNVTVRTIYRDMAAIKEGDKRVLAASNFGYWRK